MSKKHTAWLMGLTLAALAAAPAMTHTSALAAQETAAPAADAPTIPEALKPLFTGITLTETQVQKVLDVHNKHHAIGAMATMPNDTAHAGMGAGATDARLEEARELRTTLTPEQQKVFDKNLETVKASWGRKS